MDLGGVCVGEPRPFGDRDLRLASTMMGSGGTYNVTGPGVSGTIVAWVPFGEGLCPVPEDMLDCEVPTAGAADMKRPWSVRLMSEMLL